MLAARHQEMATDTPTQLHHWLWPGKRILFHPPPPQNRLLPPDALAEHAVLPHQLCGGAEGTDDDLRVEAFLHVGLHLLQELGSEQRDGRGAIANLHGQRFCVTASRAAGETASKPQARASRGLLCSKICSWILWLS